MLSLLLLGVAAGLQGQLSCSRGSADCSTPTKMMSHTSLPYPPSLHYCFSSLPASDLQFSLSLEAPGVRTSRSQSPKEEEEEERKQQTTTWWCRSSGMWSPWDAPWMRSGRRARMWTKCCPEWCPTISRNQSIWKGMEVLVLCASSQWDLVSESSGRWLLLLLPPLFHLLSSSCHPSFKTRGVL